VKYQHIVNNNSGLIQIPPSAPTLLRSSGTLDVRPGLESIAVCSDNVGPLKNAFSLIYMNFLTHLRACSLNHENSA
jgi:hypothetical protein